MITSDQQVAGKEGSLGDASVERARAGLAGEQLAEIRKYLHMRLSILGRRELSDQDRSNDPSVEQYAREIRERNLNTTGTLSPPSQRVQDFLERKLAAAGAEVPRIPGRGESLLLDQAGMARMLSIPENSGSFERDIVKSYDLGEQGILNNPEKDRRTTKGTFHVVDFGQPVPNDKRAVPPGVFSALLKHALNPPEDLNQLPYLDGTEARGAMVKLQMRVPVVPEAPGFREAGFMETVVLGPGGLVSNLDFLESIFGNAGNPYFSSSSLRLDPEHNTGATSCIIFAPHLINCTKQELGLPHRSEASERQIRDEMFYDKPDEKYNRGGAFKITGYDDSAVSVTVIADNYFGYGKKTVKADISAAANIHGLAQEEHAGGAQVFPSYNLGEFFSAQSHLAFHNHTFDNVLNIMRGRIDVSENGSAVDKEHPTIVYVNETFEADLRTFKCKWSSGTTQHEEYLEPDKIYVLPSGFKISLVENEDTRGYDLVGTEARGVLCHKPWTVSGGGKSEISKQFSELFKTGAFVIQDFDSDIARVKEVLEHDFSERFCDREATPGRPILSDSRSFGSVVKLLTPSETEYTAEYNEWLESIPYHVREMIYHLKANYTPDMGSSWEEHYSVEERDGEPVNHLYFNGEPVHKRYVRFGHLDEHTPRWLSLRNDFEPAAKLQKEDDITVSITVPGAALQKYDSGFDEGRSYKIVLDVEQMHFQRPDDAKDRGADSKAEADLAGPGVFVSNFQPLVQRDAMERVAQRIEFGRYTPAMQELITSATRPDGSPYFVASDSHRVLDDGSVTPNPRYLEPRADRIDPFPEYLAEASERLHRRLPFDRPLVVTVDAVLPGRRVNPPDAEAGILPLSVYNPIHYQEPPELYMDLIASLTGKSPSTTGAGSEGALTKGPFNALPAVIDLNDSLVSDILTGVGPFSTAAGHLGPHYQVGHDVSMIVPEIIARMSPQERDPEYLIQNGFLSKVEDFEYEGRTVPASILGYRMNDLFMNRFWGNVLSQPHRALTSDMLRPEEQDLSAYVDGIDNIVASGRNAATHYFEDGTVELAAPPVKALLHIMHHGYYDMPTESGEPQRLTLASPELREMFTAEHLLDSDWYRDRLQTQCDKDIALFERNFEQITDFLEGSGAILDETERSEYEGRRDRMVEMLQVARGSSYIESLRGSIGADPNSYVQDFTQ